MAKKVKVRVKGFKGSVNLDPEVAKALARQLAEHDRLAQSNGTGR